MEGKTGTKLVARGETIPSEGWKDRQGQKEDLTPDRWEELLPKGGKALKVRKPPVEIKHWFGFPSETESSDTDDSDWTEIDQKGRNEEKRRHAKRKRKDMMAQSAMRASCMIGLGPINRKRLENYRKDGITYERAKIRAIEELLIDQLGYEEEELVELLIAETRMTHKGEDIIYVVFIDQDQLKEIHVRKAEARNYDFLVRN